MEIKAEFSSVAFSSISCSLTACTEVLSKSWRQVVDSCGHLGRADGSKFKVKARTSLPGPAVAVTRSPLGKKVDF